MKGWTGIRENLAPAIELLAAHRLRTALSLSGLLVGAAAVVVMASIGAGAERQLAARVEALGTNLVIITPAPAPPIAGRRRQVAAMTTLRPRHALAIADESFFARAVAPGVRRSLVAQWEGRHAPTTVSGTTAEGLRIRNIEAAAGRTFDEYEDRERRRVALLGAAVTRNLFGELDPVGREIRIERTPFEVIGVMRRRGTDPAGTDLDNEIAIPLETAMRRVLNIPYLHTLYVQARRSQELGALEVEVRQILSRHHGVRSGIPEPFVVQNQAALLRTGRRAAGAVHHLTLGAAALALFVGGIGVFAIMLMAVRERTDEIGLRRAVGARRRDIGGQFLLESVLLAAAGGGAGVVAGMVVTAIAALVGPWELILSWPAAAAGLLSATILGISAGVIPALRAARLAPSEALRTPV